MRVVSWNMGYNFGTSPHREAWEYLLDDLRPDIALLQEAVVPKEVRASYTCFPDPPTTTRWGSAIVVGDLQADPVTVPEDSLLLRFPSRVILASVDVGGERALVASVHPSTRGGPALENLDRQAIATSDGTLWEANVIFHGLNELARNATRFIFGGDWMITPMWDDRYGTTSHREFLQRAVESGWVESTSHCFGVPEIDLRTWYGVRSRRSTPYQLDRIFLDTGLSQRISNCDVIVHPAQCLGLSDHAPLVLDLPIG